MHSGLSLSLEPCLQDVAGRLAGSRRRRLESPRRVKREKHDHVTVLLSPTRTDARLRTSALGQLGPLPFVRAPVSSSFPWDSLGAAGFCALYQDYHQCDRCVLTEPSPALRMNNRLSVVALCAILAMKQSPWPLTRRRQSNPGHERRSRRRKGNQGEWRSCGKGTRRCCSRLISSPQTTKPTSRTGHRGATTIHA